MYYAHNLYPYPQYQMYYPLRQYPQVDTSVFGRSVTAFKKITYECMTILEKFTDKNFRQTLMTAAQVGNQKEVDRLIKSIGTPAPIETQYTPSGILLNIHAEEQGVRYGTLTMYLKWGN